MINKAKELVEFIKKYERLLSPGALLLGFIVDNLTLQRIDLPFENILLATHLVIVGACIILINSRERSFFARIGLGGYTGVLRLIMQFSLGALFSGFFVFYTRSGTLVSSWIFFIILLTLLVSNEFLREKYDKIIYQMSLYYIAIFSYSIFLVPILIKRIGVIPFLLSGLFSLIVITLILLLIYKIIPRLIHHHQRSLVASILGIFATFNLLYFTNIIPPIPLSLSERGIYHSVNRTSDGYVITYEKPFLFFVDWKRNVKIRVGDPVYAYSAVFAPTDINTVIYHDWAFYNEERREWVDAGRIEIPVSGGRDGGFRGYSIKNNVQEGTWRVDVVTERNQLLGRMKFDIETVINKPELEEKTL